MSGYDEIDVSSPTFARRFATLLGSHRVRTKQYLWRLSRHSGGRFSVEDLKDLESGRAPLDEDTVHAITDLYGATIESLLPPRERLHVSPMGTISANGVEMTFDPDDTVAMLAAYLDLVRRLRDQTNRRVIELRREDVEALADHLQDAGSAIVQQLARLMGANERERRAMAAMFIAGASVISVSTPSTRATPNDGPADDDADAGGGWWLGRSRPQPPDPLPRGDPGPRPRHRDRHRACRLATRVARLLSG